MVDVNFIKMIADLNLEHINVVFKKNLKHQIITFGVEISSKVS